jgi:cobalt/nickel transport system permease protein
MLVMTAVIAVQALLFQDGGLVVMGGNILNMGLLTAVVGYGLYRSVVGRSQSTKLIVAGVAAWISVMSGALATSLELWLSGTVQLNIVVPAMLAVHALIGVGEALITVAALGFIFRTRPDLLDEKSVSAQGSRGWILAGVLIVLIVVFLSPLASTNPDGLERVAGDLGFIHTGRYASYRILLDYTVPILGSTSMSTILAGAIGVTVLLVLAFLAGRSLQKKS